MLFDERAPAYEALWKALRRAAPTDVLVVIGTQGNVLPINDMVRTFPGRTVLNNLHESPWVLSERFTRVLRGRAADMIHELLAMLEEWRSAQGSSPKAS